MIEIFHKVNIDWLGNRRKFIFISIALMLAGLVSAVGRHAIPGGTDAFNLGVDFKGGTVVTVSFLKSNPSAEQVSAALQKAGIHDAVVQPVAGKPQFLIKLPQQVPTSAATPQQGQADVEAARSEVDAGRSKVREALSTIGPEYDPAKPDQGAFKIEGTDAVGPVAGQQLRNQAIAVTLAAMVGILLFISFRFEWSYGAAAVIAVFHDVLVTLGIFSIFQWEISLTVIAALLTLVGFSVNDTIVVFDRIRENLKLHRRDSLYKVTNDSINQTLSRTVITSGLVFLSVLAMVIFGGEVLRGFSLALLIGIAFGTYSSVAIASPIMVWWQQRLDVPKPSTAQVRERGAVPAARAPRTRAARSTGNLNSPSGSARS
jgi:preprotein translocase subunit SecF